MPGRLSLHKFMLQGSCMALHKMISKEILSSAANAHRSAIFTLAVLTLSGTGAIVYIASAVQPLAQGLTAPSKVSRPDLSAPCRLEPCTVSSVRFVGATLAQPPSNLGPNVGNSMIPTRPGDPSSRLCTSPTSTLHSNIQHKLKIVTVTASCKWLLAVMWCDTRRAALSMMSSLPNMAATLKRPLCKPLACSGSFLRATWSVYHSLIARALSVLTLWLQ